MSHVFISVAIRQTMNVTATIFVNDIVDTDYIGIQLYSSYLSKHLFI